MQLSKIKILSGNAIKLLAAACMLIDHIGVLWNISVLRIIGRLSMPLFAFLIAEGCLYTKNKTKHFSLIFLLAILCQIVYVFIEPDKIYLSILFTFSLSIITIYSLQYFKKCIFSSGTKIFDKILSALLFIGVVAAVYFINSINTINGKPFYIDYGFWGCMLPVFASLMDFRNVTLPEKAKWLNNYYLRLIMFAIGLTLMCLLADMGATAWYAFIAFVPLLLYNNTRGKFNIKYFFYIFYPMHLAVLYGILMLF